PGAIVTSYRQLTTRPARLAILLASFLCRCRAHRDLHSFPTRRSSDLVRAQAVGGVVCVALLHCDVVGRESELVGDITVQEGDTEDRKSTRLNSSHVEISYAVFCLKKKKKVRHDGQALVTPDGGAERRR